jgi:hypothetical protein
MGGEGWGAYKLAFASLKAAEMKGVKFCDSESEVADGRSVIVDWMAYTKIDEQPTGNEFVGCVLPPGAASLAGGVASCTENISPIRKLAVRPEG